MKKLIVASAILAAAGTASADGWFENCEPIVGLDFKWAQVRNTTNWKHIFTESYPGGTIYLATKFDKNIGAELGYDLTAKKGKQTSLNPGDIAGGAASPAPAGLFAKAGFRGPYLDLIGVWPINEDDCTELFVSLGLGWVKPKVKINQVGGSSNTFIADITSVTGKTETITRLGIGGNWMASDFIGLRIKVLWENTSKLRVKHDTTKTAVLTNFEPWRNSCALAIGAFVKF
jgi:hypothetical protein